MANDRIAGIATSRAKRIDEALQRAVDASEIAGAVALVHRHGEEAHAVALGWQDLERKIPMRRDSIFRIASMTKPIAAVAALTLVEEGVLRLFDPIDRWLPELANRPVLREPFAQLDDVVPAARPTTLHDLLTFRIGTGWGPSTMRGQLLALTAAPLSTANGIPGEPLDADAFMKKLGSLPLAYQPGARWLYHTPADVLGVLISRAAGKPFETVLRERIFEPLGMIDTSFSIPADKRSRLAVLYLRDENGKLQIRDGGGADSIWNAPPLFQSAGGGLLSTADDYEKFAQMMLGKGELRGVRILSRKSVEAMCTDWLTPEQRKIPFAKFDRYDLDDGQIWTHRGFGYGVSVRADRIGLGPNPGAITWPGAFGTSWIADFAESLTMTLLLQRIWQNPFYTRIGDEVLTMTYQAIAD